MSVNSVADYNITQYWYLPKEKGAPKRIAAELAENSPKGLFEEVQANAVGKLTDQDFDDDYLLIDENMARISSYLIRQYKPSFVAVHLVTVDHFEHEQGRDGDKVRAAVAGVDRAVKTIVEGVEKAGLKEKTTFIITGDHGFVNIESTLVPNVLLAKDGLYDPEKKETWKAYFHASGDASFLHVKDKSDEATKAMILQLLKSLPENEQQMFLVKSRKHLDVIGANPEVAMALTGKKGYSFNNAVTGNFVRKDKGGTHAFYLDFKEIQTGFVAFSAGIQKGVVVDEMSLAAIAPLITLILGLGLPKGDGQLRTEFLTNNFQKR